MKNKILALVLFLLVSNPVMSETYYIALDHFNKKKIKKSIQLFQKVADDKNSTYQDKAIFNLAVIYDNGYGVKPDKTKAIYYYNIASDMNNEFAMYNLGWMYQVGENINKDAVKHLNYIRNQLKVTSNYFQSCKHVLFRRGDYKRSTVGL